MKQIIRIFSILVILLICCTTTIYGNTLDWSQIHQQASGFIANGKDKVSIDATGLVQRSCKHINHNWSCYCFNRDFNYRN